MVSRFNVRVYGIWLKDNQVMVSDEIIGQRFITKFPGGGVEFGEGLIEALKREWQEELNVEIIVKEQFYVNDFFQISSFSSEDQVLSIYYFVEPIIFPDVVINNKPFAFTSQELKQVFRFIPISLISAQDFSLPIDKVVGEMLAKIR